MFKRSGVFFVLLLALLSFISCEHKEKSELAFNDLMTWSKEVPLPDEYGLAGGFAGYHDGVILFAGGSNFETHQWRADAVKVYSDIVYALIESEDGTRSWKEQTVRLPEPVAYGASVTLRDGILCFGGMNGEKVFDTVFLLRWNSQTGEAEISDAGKMPFPLANMQAALIGNDIYLIAGQTGLSTPETMSDAFLKTTYRNGTLVWSDVNAADRDGNEYLNVFPGGERILVAAASQFNGENESVYVVGGRKELGGDRYEFFSDTWEFNPTKSLWSRKSDAPVPLMGASAVSVGMAHIFILNGAQGDLLTQLVNGDLTQENHPGFHKQGFAYYTITDSWMETPATPANQVTAPVIRSGYGKNDPIYIISGETKPQIRTPDVWRITLNAVKPSFGWVNFSVIGIYLLGIVGVGVFFYFRNKNTDDFFKGGGRIPFWVAAFSIFATMLSSITFIAVPGKAFATNWGNFVLQFSMFIVTPIVVIFFLPFFRRITSASAYEYLEKRFNLFARLFASASFIIFHIGRMGIVMYLPAIALSMIVTISPDPQVNQVICILIMGVLSMIYCAMGGLEAVVWTDTIQSFVLLGGAIVTVVLIIFSVGGLPEFFTTAVAADKFKMIEWDWSLTSYMIPAFWVVLLGGFGQNLVPYASDMSIVQRYMSVKDEKAAKKSIWTNTIISVVASALFFFLGTALFVFYKNNPTYIDPLIDKVDYVFPVFISQELPIGIAGLVVAAIFAAAQSTVSTSINSATAAIVTDFFQRFDLATEEKKGLLLSRIVTVLFGLIGTLTGVIFVYLSSRSLWDNFMTILGLVGGAMCGLFCLGIFTKRASGISVSIATIIGVASTWLIGLYTPVHPYLYALINVVITFVSGYLLGFIFPSDPQKVAEYSIYGKKIKN